MMEKMAPGFGWHHTASRAATLVDKPPVAPGRCKLSSPPVTSNRPDGTMAAMSRASHRPRLLRLTTLLVCELLALLVVFRSVRWLRTSPHSYAVAIGVGCIIPLMTIAVFTAHRFRRDRLPLSGHCRRCGYNLTGNVSGIFPERGTDA